MKKITLLTTVFLTATICMACGGKVDSPTTAPAIETTNQAQTSTAAPTTVKETIIETTEQVNTDSLEDFLSAYPDSKAYHLFFDIMKNSDSKTNQDSGVTYMFSKDSNGNRTNEALSAYYSGIDDLSSTDSQTFCSEFIAKHFPELSIPFENAETTSEPKYMQAAIFKDYTIVLMPDKDNKGMTVMISKSK